MLGLSKKNIQRLLSFTSADQVKTAIRGVHVTQEKSGYYGLSATDGYRLIKITVPDREYTITPMETKTITTPKIILSGVLEKLDKVFTNTKASLPMANKAWIHNDGIYYNNLEGGNDRVIMEAKEVFIDAKFPDTDSILKQFDGKPHTITVNACLLTDVAKVFASGGVNMVKITLGEKNVSPILFEGKDEEHNKIQAVLMPIRTSDDI